MKHLRIERWTSSQNNLEAHFFIDGTQTYVAGFNPDLIDEASLVAFLKEHGLSVSVCPTP